MRVGSDWIVKAVNICEQAQIKLLRRGVCSSVCFLFFQIFEKAFHSGIIVRVTFRGKWLHNIHTVRILAKSLWCKLRASVGVKYQAGGLAAACYGKIERVNGKLSIDMRRNLVRDDFSRIQIQNCAQVVIPVRDPDVCKIAAPYHIGSRLVKVFFENIRRITMSFIRWYTFIRLYGTHFRQIHSFHQAAHSSDADVYAIITSEADGNFTRAQSLICFGINF